MQFYHRQSRRHGGRRLLPAVGALLVLGYFLSAQPCAADKQDVVRVYIPLFFATDRVQKQSQKEHIVYGKQNTERLDSISYGIVGAESKVRDLPGADLVRLSALGWTQLAGDSSADKTASAGDSVPQDYQNCTFATWEELENAVRTAMKDSGKQQLVIYVHGCCIGFRGASEQAVTLAAQLRVPVLFYDWGSPGGNYVGSLLSCPRGQERFNQFILRVLRAFPSQRITVVGLSMGNLLIYNFCLQNQARDLPRKLDDIEMARPDIDSIAFRSNMQRVVEHCGNVRLYVARNDFKINLSGFIRGMLYPSPPVFMLGHPHDKALLHDQIQVFDVSKLKLGHVLPSGVIAEVIKNDGMPAESSNYSYRREDGGIIAVTKGSSSLRVKRVADRSPAGI